MNEFVYNLNQQLRSYGDVRDQTWNICVQGEWLIHFTTVALQSEGTDQPGHARQSDQSLCYSPSGQYGTIGPDKEILFA